MTQKLGSIREIRLSRYMPITPSSPSTSYQGEETHCDEREQDYVDICDILPRARLVSWSLQHRGMMGVMRGYEGGEKEYSSRHRGYHL